MQNIPLVRNSRKKKNHIHNKQIGRQLLGLGAGRWKASIYDKRIILHLSSNCDNMIVSQYQHFPSDKLEIGEVAQCKPYFDRLKREVTANMM